MITRRQNPEELLQLAVAKFLNAALDDNSLWFHVPNGGWRSFTEAKRLKNMGVMAGLPDIEVISGGRAIWIELKTPGGRVSDAQVHCHQRLQQARCPVSVCRSVEEVERALRAAGVPLRATTEPKIIGAFRKELNTTEQAEVAAVRKAAGGFLSVAPASALSPSAAKEAQKKGTLL